MREREGGRGREGERLGSREGRQPRGGGRGGAGVAYGPMGSFTWFGWHMSKLVSKTLIPFIFVKMWPFTFGISVRILIKELISIAAPSDGGFGVTVALMIVESAHEHRRSAGSVCVAGRGATREDDRAGARDGSRKSARARDGTKW